MKVAFDEPSHTYTLDGHPAPGVSSILEPAYDFRFVKEDDLIRTRELGKKVHKTVELFELGRLNRETLHPFLADHLKQWIAFKNDMGYVPLLT